MFVLEAKAQRGTCDEPANRQGQVRQSFFSLFKPSLRTCLKQMTKHEWCCSLYGVVVVVQGKASLQGRREPVGLRANQDTFKKPKDPKSKSPLISFSSSSQARPQLEKPQQTIELEEKRTQEGLHSLRQKRRAAMDVVNQNRRPFPSSVPRDSRWQKFSFF